MPESKCKNCGAAWSLHQWKTLKCPAGGREETREGHKQQWQETVYEASIADIDLLREENAYLKAKIRKMEDYIHLIETKLNQLKQNL